MKVESTPLGKGRLVAVTALIVALIGVTLYLVAYQGYLGNRASSAHESSASSLGSSSSATGTSTYISGSSTSSATMGTATAFTIFPCNCTVDLSHGIWPEYRTMQDLAPASVAIIVGSVTSERTIGVNESSSVGRNVGLVPVTDYNVTVTTVLFDSGNHFGIDISPGYWTIVPQIGGTFGHTTMNVTGYPTLSVGASYVFFLAYQSSIQPNLYNGLTTIGATQGLFYIQGGNVYSLDNMYPSADAWLPVKADGVSLSEFITQVQSAVTTTSSSAAQK